MQILSSSLRLHTFPFLVDPHLHPPKSLKFQNFSRIFKEKSKLRSSKIQCGSKKSSFGDRKEDGRKNHYTIMKKNIVEGSELFDEEFRNFSISLPAMLILSGKQQVSGMIYHLVSFLKKNIEIVVRPAAIGGADIGIRWHIEWKAKDLHMLPGCTLDSSHAYYGKIFLRNGKALLDPLWKWKPTKLIGKEGMVEILNKMLEKMGSHFPRDKSFLLGHFYFICFLIMLVLCLILGNTFT